MAWFSKKDKNEEVKTNSNATMVKPSAPKPPVAPGSMPPPPGAPRPMNGPTPTFGAPSVVKPPVAPGSMPPPPGAPRPMNGPTPTFGAPSVAKPPMSAPGSMFSPQGTTPGVARPMPYNTTMEASSFSMNSDSTNLDGILSSKKGYSAPKSIHNNGKISYDQFCRELSYDFLDSLLKSPSIVDEKSLISRIKKTLIFALVNTKDLPDGERELLYATAIRFVDFLKGVVYYPEKEVINDDVITFLPFLKDTAQAFRSFLMKNR